MKEAIVIDNITKSFGAQALAVNGLGFAVPEGSVVGFLGPNGAGKSTTIRMLLGLLRPSAGSASLLGHDSRELPASIWSRVGYVAEEPGLYRWMTVGAMIRYTAAFYPNWDAAFAADLLKRLELPAGQKIGSMSRGQRGKLALLLALAFRPELLVLDDPVSGLDPIVRREFLDQIIELLQMEGRTVLFSSHILDEVERLADRIVIVDQGRLLTDDTLDALKGRVKRAKLTFENEPPPGDPPGLGNVRRNGRFIAGTLLDCSEGRLAELRAIPGAALEVEDLNLNEIFVECVKGGK
jgi:ABC-2 type transport system ATP-binding protein